MANKRNIQVVLSILIAACLLAAPAAAFAQEIQPPPTWTGDQAVSDEDLLVFEPQFFFELPFADGFQISINFGFSIRVPRRLMLVDQDVYNFFVKFRSYVIPGGGETTTP